MNHEAITIGLRMAHTWFKTINLYYYMLLLINLQTYPDNANKVTYEVNVTLGCILTFIYIVHISIVMQYLYNHHIPFLYILVLKLLLHCKCCANIF